MKIFIGTLALLAFFFSFEAKTGICVDEGRAVLFTSKYCDPCQRAEWIIERLQKEDYDVIIVDIHGEPWERVLAYKKQIRSVPTLMTRYGQFYVGLLSEGEYRSLISKARIDIRPYFTGSIRFVDNDVEIDAPGYKQLNPKKYPELAKRYNITRPTLLVLLHGRVISRTPIISK